MDGWVGDLMDGWVNGWMGEWMGGWMGGWMGEADCSGAEGRRALGASDGGARGPWSGSAQEKPVCVTVTSMTLCM